MRRAAFAVLGLLVVSGLVACRDCSSDPASAPDASAEVAPPASTSAQATLRNEARPEAGALVDPRCEGMSLSLFEISCEVPDAEWVATPAPPPGTLVQEARLEGQTVVFALANHGTAPVSVPLRFDDRQPGRSFSVIAEVDGGIYELASPRVILAADAGTATAGTVPDAGAHLHSTRIKLLAGGKASARLTIDPLIVERLDKRGTMDAGARGPLAEAFTLHVGQLFSHIDVGDPARVSFVNGLAKR